MFNEREARAELRAIELAEALAEQDLQIERQKWQKEKPCNYNESKPARVGLSTSDLE